MTPTELKRPQKHPATQWVARWMCSHVRCFKSACNVGLRHSRVDVLGIRDVGGILSGEIETICMEVKRGAEPFATASGQALGYSIYAHRVYLADFRDEAFKPSEQDIASHLGIGLIQLSLSGKRCKEVLSSPLHNPMPRMSLELIAKLTLAKCQLCGTFFECGKDYRNNRLSKVVKDNLQRAVASKKGLVFWLHDLAAQRNGSGLAEGMRDLLSRNVLFALSVSSTCSQRKAEGDNLSGPS